MEQLIYENLISEGAVFFPDLGSICVTGIPARFSNAGIVPPSKKLSFVQGECLGISVVDIIARENRILSSDAQQLYWQWRDYNSNNGVLVVPGIGALAPVGSAVIFEADPALKAELSPYGDDPMPFVPEMPEQERKSGGAGKIVLTIVGVLLILMLIGAGYLYFMMGVNPIDWVAGFLK